MACLKRPSFTTLIVYLVYLLTLFGSYCQMAPVANNTHARRINFTITLKVLIKVIHFQKIFLFNNKIIKKFMRSIESRRVSDATGIELYLLND
ncbi:microsomal triacylglycerol transfer protein isoform X1 [Vespula squamosa]|uniref:Microsomal triacylglycerol transfer protein isoform X1 n=1 Tax=Vespula squamosa TaxID=30214 RepID=A0ABD2A0K1_VESSQ